MDIESKQKNAIKHFRNPSFGIEEIKQQSEESIYNLPAEYQKKPDMRIWNSLVDAHKNDKDPTLYNVLKKSKDHFDKL